MKTKDYKLKFLIFFDGCYGVDPQKDTVSTYKMGVCKLEYVEKTNTLTVHLRRPGLLIGAGGQLIDRLEKYLDCKISIKEVLLRK